MQGIFLQIRYFGRELSKSFKKDNFIFLSNRMSFVCHSNVIRMSCHLCVSRMYSYVIRMSLVYTRMSSVCHWYVLVCHRYVTRIYSVCHSYVTRMWFYHEPLFLKACFEYNRKYREILWIDYTGNSFDPLVLEITTHSCIKKIKISRIITLE